MWRIIILFNLCVYRQLITALTSNYISSLMTPAMFSAEPWERLCGPNSFPVSPISCAESTTDYLFEIADSPSCLRLVGGIPMAERSRKRRVGVVDPPDLRSVIRTPSPKRGNFAGRSRADMEANDSHGCSKWNKRELAGFLRSKGMSSAASKFEGEGFSWRHISKRIGAPVRVSCLLANPHTIVC